MGLEAEIGAGTPVVTLEPSCGSVFREELTNFYPNEQNAMRLQKQTFVLSEFLKAKAPEFRPPGYRVLVTEPRFACLAGRRRCLASHSDEILG